MVEKFKIIAGRDLQWIEERAGKMIGEGWEPCGGLVVVAGIAGFESETLAQAFWKRPQDVVSTTVEDVERVLLEPVTSDRVVDNLSTGVRDATGVPRGTSKDRTSLTKPWMVEGGTYGRSGAFTARFNRELTPFEVHGIYRLISDHYPKPRPMPLVVPPSHPLAGEPGVEINRELATGAVRPLQLTIVGSSWGKIELSFNRAFDAQEQSRIIDCVREELVFMSGGRMSLPEPGY